MMWRNVLKNLIGSPVVWIIAAMTLTLGFGVWGGYSLASDHAAAQLALKDVAYNTLVISYQDQHAKDVQAAITKGKEQQRKADEAAILLAKSVPELIAQNQKLKKDISHVLQADKPRQDNSANGCTEYNGIGPNSLRLYTEALGYSQ